ncbi:MAG: transglycosylase domain-containing protein [Anaerolineae bacterium]|nr:transglycosylase domain-containing protein [Anaerolineae bacterium]
MSSVPQIIRRRRRRRRESRPGLAYYGGLSTVGVLLLLIVATLAGALVIGAFSYLGVASVIPADPQAVRPALAGATPTRLLDRETRTVLYEVSNPLDGQAAWVALADLPEYVWQATVTIEDATFFERPGFTLAGMVSAVSDAVIQGRNALNDPVLRYLAQQVLVPLYEMPLTSADRATTDAVLMLELRRRFSREELLEWFLNTAFYGNGAYGIEAAAQVYFGRSAGELTLAEAALLAGVVEEPSANPFDQPTQAERRQSVVLDTMVAYGLLDPDTADAAAGPVAVMRPLAPNDVPAPHYVLAARRQAEQLLNDAGYDGARLVAQGGLRITTTLDLDLQVQAECALRTHLSRLGGADPEFVFATSTGDPCYTAAWLPELAAADVGVSHDVHNGAVVIVRPETGEVLAYVGNTDYWNETQGGYVDAAAAGYQPGSLIRPYAYLTAFSQGYTTATMLLDVPQTFEQSFGATYQAVSTDGLYRGPLSLRRAMVEDATPPAVEVMNLVGVPDTVRTAHRMGISGLRDGPTTYDLSLAVQGGDVSLLDLTYSFSVLAGSGRMMGAPVAVERQQEGFRALDPVLVTSIEDEDGNVLWRYEAHSRDILAAPLAYLMNDVLGDREARAQAYGVDNVYEIGRPVAVSAGGSGDGRDIWAVGYTPQLVAGVWLGNVDRAPTYQLDAENGSAAIWQAVLRYAHQRDLLPSADWARPSDIVEVRVCAVSGLLPSSLCPTVAEVFAADTQPTQQDTYYQAIEINRGNGLRATASTPRDLVEAHVYFMYPPAAQQWALEQGIEMPPEQYDAIGVLPVIGPVAILEPEPLQYVSGQVEIRGNATLPDFQYFQLAYGQGLNPAEWLQVGERIYNPVRGQLLGRWDTTGLSGLYSLRLTVVTSANTVEESVLQVTVDNTPPQIAITAPEPDEEFRVTGVNPVINAAVEYSDNVGVVEVIYYLDGSPVTTVIEPPFAAPIVLSEAGPHSIWAEAFDAAGNSQLSERVAFTVLRDPGN